MSSDSDKPFQCNVPGCGQRFANHDHLSTHQQKHEFSIKFRAGEVSLVDQTPTPTRFLRNCEESGLFQELEEANPFEQDFKDGTAVPKQILSTPLSVSMTVRDSNSGADHQTNREKPPKVAEVVAQTVVDPLPRISGVAMAAIPVAPPASLINPNKPVAMATAPPHISTASALTKQKLLQTIQLKEQRILEQTISQQLGNSPELLAQAIKSLIPQVAPETSTELNTVPVTENNAVFAMPTEIPGRRKRGRKPDDEDPEIKRQKFLERNRAAASRCRAKKKQWVDNLEKKSKDIETQNDRMQQEMAMLRSEVQQLKSILIAHKDCPLIVHQPNKDVDGEQHQSSGGMTLLAQLSKMPSIAPLISSPVPSVGSVVPNMSPSTVFGQHVQTLPSTIIVTSNGLVQHQTPEVAKDVEISAEVIENQTDN